MKSDSQLEVFSGKVRITSPVGNGATCYHLIYKNKKNDMKQQKSHGFYALYISIGVEKKPDPRLKSHSALEMIYDCKTNFYYCNLLHTCNLPAETKLKFKLGFHGESAACVRCCV